MDDLTQFMLWIFKGTKILSKQNEYLWFTDIECYKLKLNNETHPWLPAEKGLKWRGLLVETEIEN